MMSQKLVHYFQAHPISVVNFFPISDVLNNQDATGRIAKWAMEFMAFTIIYAPPWPFSPKILPTSWLSGLKSNPHPLSSNSNTVCSTSTVL